MSEWYRCTARWRNGVHRLRAGVVYELDDAFVAAVRRDAGDDGILVRLTPEVRAEVAAALSYGTEATGVEMCPPGPETDDPRLAWDGHTRGTGSRINGADAMHTGNSGLAAR